jgi:glycosyltransferase involved in cell wall biosynthesis
MPFFSFIIPTYNRATIISPTIQSVINQQFTDWELIIVDDGGTDNTKEIVKSFNDSRIKYYWKENGERGAARNYGVLHAKGKYVFFLDSDDLIYANHLKHAFEKLNELNLPEFFHSRYEEVFPIKTVQVEKLNMNTIWKTIQKQNKFACQFFLRKDIALQIPFSENRNLKIGEDWLVILQIGLKYQLNVSNQVTSAIVQHNNRSMQLTPYKDVLVSRDLIIEKLEIFNNVEKIINNVYFELTSLASLSAVLQNEKIKGLSLISGLFIKYPIKVLEQRRIFAIIKHLFK